MTQQELKSVPYSPERTSWAKAIISFLGNAIWLVIIRLAYMIVSVVTYIRTLHASTRVSDEATATSQEWAAAKTARLRWRHGLLLLSFIVMVLLPALTVSWYMMTRAADQYASTLGFTVRQAENTSAAVDLIGGITSLGSEGSKNTDILFEYIQSQQLISIIEDELKLTTIYSKPDNDPIFSYDKDGTIEDLVKYWNRMVKIYYDNKTGLIEVKVLAFEPEDARKIGQEIVVQSSLMINELNSVAQADATRYAKEELDQSVTRLKAGRQALTEFRTKNQIVDPTVDLQGQMGLLNSLQQQLADALVELDLLSDVTRSSDPRIEQVRRKIDVINARISEERKKLVVSDGSTGAFSSLIGEFEALRVDLEFAEQSYVSSLAAYDNAVADAQRKSIYLASYIEPTLAERSDHPKRGTIIGLSTLFLFLFWSITVLIAYSIRDRR